MFGTGQAVRKPEKMGHKGWVYRILMFGQQLGVLGLIESVQYATLISKFDSALCICIVSVLLSSSSSRARKVIQDGLIPLF